MLGESAPAFWANTTKKTKPGVGTGSLDYYNNKFHNDFLRNVKSRVSMQYHDKNWVKRKNDLTHFKSGKDQVKLRQIDNKNFQFFIRLSQVRPHVPQVVKKSRQPSTEPTARKVHQGATADYPDSLPVVVDVYNTAEGSSGTDPGTAMAK